MKDDIVDDSILLEIPRKHKSIETKSWQWLLRAGGRAVMGSDGYGISFGRDENVFELDGVNGYALCMFGMPLNYRLYF